ncbi:MAG: hypothetical protein L6Q75_04570 [Burkholderiaceae bacterium]|nr:hypothetical protein [Burkholderiaceae bacterium]
MTPSTAAHSRLTLCPPKPRNPFVAAARLRAAGRHGPDGGARRQRERQALRRELRATGPDPRHRGEP